MILQPLLHSRPFFLAWLERLWWFLVTRVVGAKGARGDSAPLPILRDHLTLSQPEGAYHVNYITAGPPDFQTFLRSCNFTTAMTETNWFVQTMNQPNFIMGLFSQVLTTQCRNQILLFWFFFQNHQVPKWSFPFGCTIFQIWMEIYRISKWASSKIKFGCKHSFDELKTKFRYAWFWKKGLKLKIRLDQNNIWRQLKKTEVL